MFYESIYKKEEENFVKEIEDLKKSQQDTLQRIDSLFSKKKKEYSFNFTKNLKENIKKRDNFECQLCKSKKDLNIHHIDYKKKNTQSGNLITLCRKCNLRVNKKSERKYYTEHFRRLVHYRLSRK